MRILVVLALLFIVVSCIKDEYQGPEPGLPSRTVLVYLGGDNELLSKTLLEEVEALRQGWTYTGNRCLIYIDPVDDVPLLLSLRGGCATTPVPYIDTLMVYEEENSASAGVFSRVIKEVVERHPADSYGLIFASHGSGWLSSGALAYPSRSVGSDSNVGISINKGNEMELMDFAGAIEDEQFDFIIFEASLMAGVEVAYELRNTAKFIMASSAELLVPGFVPIYPSALKELFNMKLSTDRKSVV